MVVQRSIHGPSWSSESMTHLSYRRVGPTREARHAGMARRSLFGLVMSFAALGCLYPDPAEYNQAAQTKPHLYSPVPPTTEILAVNSGETVRITVRLESEDAGDDVTLMLYLNYLVPGRVARRQDNMRKVPPGTSDEPRTVFLDWTVPERVGGSCEQLSLVVTHQSNLGDSYLPEDPDDVSVLTWWVSINNSQVPISDCPGAPAGAS